ncbi:multidrug effflux MFS transporter [Duganella levis]|uniref:Bcr/CflA family efflux transporter n=1 Tax=Duganella levis TaxID=2692169 RepID=A0ABW9VWK3_9BURK|nr:multidrug effflux MFS transporter [Duganella levis]MYN26051.1 Bcr/CflA family efflux MFS transporter [Duganella levis]
MSTTTAQRHDLWTLTILSLLMAFASISTDIYLPAMPIMGAALHTATGGVELTISGYLVGFCLGQLFWGPLSDRLGRRLPIAIGMVLFIAGSAGCALSNSVEAMIAWRALQAVGACASVTLARAIVRDLYAGSRAAQMMSTLMIVTAVAPLLGPSIGGLILQFAGWRDIFWLLVAVGLVTLGLLYTLPETLPVTRRIREPLSRVFLTYGALLRQPRLLGYAGVGGFLYGGIFAYVAGTPFAYISYYHVPPQYYGLLFSLGSVGIMAANLFNVRFVARWGSDHLMRAGAIAAGILGISVAITAASNWGGLAGLVIPLFLFISCTGLIAANAITGALNLFPEVAGSVSALIGASQFGTGILGSALVGMLSNGTPWPLGASMAFFGLGCTLCAVLLTPSH